MPELKPLSTTRIVATPVALDAVSWPAETLALRVAGDEVILTPPVDQPNVDDPHAIVISDSSFAGVWLDMAEALEFLERACEWALPDERPAFAQGAIAGIPAKLWLEPNRVLFIVPTPFAAEFEERLA